MESNAFAISHKIPPTCILWLTVWKLHFYCLPFFVHDMSYSQEEISNFIWHIDTGHTLGDFVIHMSTVCVPIKANVLYTEMLKHSHYALTASRKIHIYLNARWL
jgi:hypothetical protein